MEVYQRDDWRELKPHPAAEVFPLMSDDELKQMADGMRKAGFDHQWPIVLKDGQVLDGRNRLHCCNAIEVEPWFADYDGDDIAGFVARANLDRRHLTQSQRAAAAVELEEWARDEMDQRRRRRVSEARRAENEVDANSRQPQPETGKQPRNANAALGQMFGVGEHIVNQAKQLKNKAPDLHEEVKAGRKTVNAAVRALQKREETNLKTEPTAKKPKAPKPHRPRERDLEGWEAIIEGKLEAFLDVSYALLEIREKRLFIEKHGQFSRYLQERWGIAFNKGRQVTVGIDAMMLVGEKGDIIREH